MTPPLPAHSPELPLFRRFPALQQVAHVSLGTFPSPVMHVDGLSDAPPIWIKRDDLNAAPFGGNKVRSLEFLLARVRAGDTVLTLGGEGSTHVLMTALLAGTMGARTSAVLWRHEMNASARAVLARTRHECDVLATRSHAVSAMVAAWWRRRSAACSIPVGGATPTGMLGHVNAALELAEQVASGELSAPRSVVLPLGSGGTTAGLALGFAITGLDTTVIGVRVAPRIGSNHWRVMQLAQSCGDLITRLTGERVPRVDPRRVRVTHDASGGAYGRVLPAAHDAAIALEHRTGIHLDDTYSAKAWLAALHAESPVLFWLTFDGRILGA
ncbi:MAG: 1-aminocyclopropane-1-carboxylate deaminase/D-cysteine desulfhydrase [Gemmatimonadaceae bacterium]